MTQPRPVQLERLIERYRNTEGVTVYDDEPAVPNEADQALPEPDQANPVEVFSFRVGDYRELLILRHKNRLTPKLTVEINQIRHLEPYLKPTSAHVTMHGIVGVYCDRGEDEIPEWRHCVCFEFSEGGAHNLGGSLDQLEHFVDKCMSVFMQSNVTDPPSPPLPERLEAARENPPRAVSQAPTELWPPPDRAPSMAPTEPQ